MGTATRRLGESTKSQSWHVRNEQGETFGPVDLETLKSWACDGRLGPTNEVSEKGAVWMPATTVCALEMDWVAEVTPGTFYGPIHRCAMEELVKDGSIAAKSAFFSRRGMDERAEGRPDAGQDDKLKRLSEELEQLRRRALASEEQALQAQRQVAAQTAQAEQARQEAAVSASQGVQLREQADAERQAREQLEAQAEQMRRQVAAGEEQVRAAQRQAAESAAQLEQAQRQAAESAAQARQQAAVSEAQVAQAREQVLCEQQMRQQFAAQVEQAQRQVATYDEQVQVAQRQVAVYATQVEQARQQAAVSEAQAAQAREQVLAAESRACEAVRQLSEQTEQARVAQQQWMAQADKLAGELESVRKEYSDVAAQAVALRVERDARAAALEAQARAFEAERQERQLALSHAQAEVAVREARMAQLEKTMAGIEGVGAERGALESQIRALNAELGGLQQALAGEKAAVQQAAARCTTLEAALEEARLHRGREKGLEDVSSELKLVRQQVDALCVQIRQSQAEREAAAAHGDASGDPSRKSTRHQGHSEKRVYVEAEPVEVLPPEGAKADFPKKEAAPVTPEWHERKTDAPSARSGQAAAGLSLADLERQARRELERLGAQGVNLFKKKK